MATKIVILRFAPVEFVAYFCDKKVGLIILKE